MDDDKKPKPTQRLRIWVKENGIEAEGGLTVTGVFVLIVGAIAAVWAGLI